MRLVKTNSYKKMASSKNSFHNCRYPYTYFSSKFGFKEPFYCSNNMNIYPYEVMDEALRSYIQEYRHDWEILWSLVIFSQSDQQVATTINQDRKYVRRRLAKFTHFINKFIAGKEIGTFQKGWTFYKEITRQAVFNRFENRSIDLDSIKLKKVDGVKRIYFKTLSQLLVTDYGLIRTWIQRDLDLSQVHTEFKTIMIRRKPVEMPYYSLTYDQAVLIAKKHEYPEIVNAAITELNYIFSKN